jgi:hypothetical protein
LEVAVATKVAATGFALLTVHFCGVTVRLVMVPRYTIAEAVPLSPCAAAVNVDVPRLTPNATPVVVSIDTFALSLDHATPLVIRLLVPSS